MSQENRRFEQRNARRLAKEAGIPYQAALQQVRAAHIESAGRLALAQPLDPLLYDEHFLQTVKRKFSLTHYLVHHLGVELQAPVEQFDGFRMHVATCPFHEDDRSSLRVSPASQSGRWQSWQCFGDCQCGGTILDAVKRAENLQDDLAAAQHLGRIYDRDLEELLGRHSSKTTISETVQHLRSYRGLKENDIKTTIEGAQELLYRAIDNAVQEHVRGFGDVIEVSVDWQNRWRVADNGRGMTREHLDGRRGSFISPQRGEKRPVTGDPHVDGYRREAEPARGGRDASGNLFVINALSEQLQVFTSDGEHAWAAGYEQGLVSSIVPVTPVGEPGTVIEAVGDGRVFGNYVLDGSQVARHLRSLSCRHPKLTFRFSNSGQQEEINSPGGLADVVEAEQRASHFLVSTSEFVHREPLTKPITLNLRTDERALDVGIGWYSAGDQLDIHRTFYVNGERSDKKSPAAQSVLEVLRGSNDRIARELGMRDYSTIRLLLHACVIACDDRSTKKGSFSYRRFTEEEEATLHEQFAEQVLLPENREALLLITRHFMAENLRRSIHFVTTQTDDEDRRLLKYPRPEQEDRLSKAIREIPAGADLSLAASDLAKAWKISEQQAEAWVAAQVARGPLPLDTETDSAA